MWREKLAKNECNLVPKDSKYKGNIEQFVTNLNKALLSVKPDASASTASGVPIFRSANIARYRSNRGSFVSSRFDWRSRMLLDEKSVGFGFSERRPDVAGAGSIETYRLLL